MSALDIQIGGGHYREGGIQPVQYIEANGLLFLEASVVKRVTRHNRATGKGRQDIEKAIHELQLLLELRYAEPAPAHEVRVNGSEGVDLVFPNGKLTEWPEDDKRIDVIGQNGNEGEHYGRVEPAQKSGGYQLCERSNCSVMHDRNSPYCSRCEPM